MSIEKYQQEIRLISHELERYNHFSVISAAVGSLTADNSDRKKAIMRMPWVLLLLLKLALLGKSGEKSMSREEYYGFSNRLYGIQHLASNLDAQTIELQLRPMLLQQLWYQRGDESALLSLFRQSLLLNGENPWYADEFRKISGIKLRNFYIITIHIMLSVKNHKLTVLDINLFQLIHNLCPQIPFNELFRYLALIGVRTSDLQAFIESHRLDDIYQSEYYQDTPFKERPILINGDQLLVVDSTLFFASMAEFVPRYLKKIPGHKDQFGPDFEKYINELLEFSKLKYWPENIIESLYKKYGIQGKVVDFLTHDEKHVILIESKAIEPSSIVKTATDPELLKKLLEKSFIKAIHQGMHSATELAKTPEFKDKKFSLLIVTHEDFGIFGGRWVADHIDTNLQCELNKKHPTTPLSLDDIFYCTINDLEDLARGQAAGTVDLFNLVESASTAEKSGLERRMIFQQVIDDHLKGSADRHQSMMREMDLYLADMRHVIELNIKFWSGKAMLLMATREQFLRELNLRQGQF
ncbi:GapS1 family protein [Pseudomonas subflava]|uniref:GapS1 family protein n=1 Tax=Pseudomonas subflava TaxID=2952933 RepID=UPI00207AAA35|nr:hypothetical protein [Pseudomonas subflava]